MAYGPSPKPTALKRLAGNPGKRSLNENEPQFTPARMYAPRYLSKAAKTEWRRVSEDLYRAGMLTTVDRAALEAYCVCYARWRDAEAAVAKTGTVIETSNGNLIQNPYLAVANRAMADMHKFMTVFGMTPSSRSRIPAAPPKDEPTLAELLFGERADG